jgi:hypothetical protein
MTTEIIELHTAVMDMIGQIWAPIQQLTCDPLLSSSLYWNLSLVLFCNVHKRKWKGVDEMVCESICRTVSKSMATPKLKRHPVGRMFPSQLSGPTFTCMFSIVHVCLLFNQVVSGCLKQRHRALRFPALLFSRTLTLRNQPGSICYPTIAVCLLSTWALRTYLFRALTNSIYPSTYGLHPSSREEFDFNQY